MVVPRFTTREDALLLSNNNNPCHAESFYVLHSSPIFILITCSVPVIISMYTLEAEWKTVWILMPADLDLRCFQKMINPGSAGQGSTLCMLDNCACSLSSRPPDKSSYWKLFSIFLIQNICCWYSKEQSQ